MSHCGILLRSPDPDLQAMAARIVGKVHALESVPDLIALVGHRDPTVVRCAASALATMAKRPLGADVEAWELWYEREQAWRDSSWTRVFDTLVSEQAGEANEALQELALHPLYRHEAAAAISESLMELSGTVALAACEELEKLASRAALPGLVTTLDQAPPQLRAAAWRALRRLSGEEHALSVSIWRAVVDS
jgi:HEAT repeat protein